MPTEAIAAARAEGLFGAAIPLEFGGEGASIGDIVDVCYTLGRACASTAMIFAMRPVAQADAWKALLPDARVSVIPNAGHLVFEEMPSAVQVAADFFAS